MPLGSNMLVQCFEHAKTVRRPRVPPQDLSRQAAERYSLHCALGMCSRRCSINPESSWLVGTDKTEWRLGERGGGGAAFVMVVDVGRTG